MKKITFYTIGLILLTLNNFSNALEDNSALKAKLFVDPSAQAAYYSFPMDPNPPDADFIRPGQMTPDWITIYDDHTATMEQHILVDAYPDSSVVSYSACDVRVIFDDNDFTEGAQYTVSNGKFKIITKDESGRAIIVQMTQHPNNYISVSSEGNFKCYLLTGDDNLYINPYTMHADQKEYSLHVTVGTVGGFN